jgi:hypothetical protein
MSRRSMARSMPPSVAGRLCKRQDCKQEGASGEIRNKEASGGHRQRSRRIDAH